MVIIQVLHGHDFKRLNSHQPHIPPAFHFAWLNMPRANMMII